MTFPKFTAVLHLKNDELAVEQAKVAMTNGADGLFLIDHGRTSKRLLLSYQKVRAALPNAWIGINFLDASPAEAVSLIPGDAQALWIDDGGIDEANKDQPLAQELYRKLCQLRPGVLLFGGVAFKYQGPVASPARAASLAVSCMDVVTTSGAGTGEAPDIDKIKAMKKAIGTHKLAVASGLSAENAKEFAPYVDCFMVATSISDTFHTLDPRKVAALADALG
jgi:predicted TIM-barrel enzyme